MAARCPPSVTSARCWSATRASAERPRRAWRSRGCFRTALRYFLEVFCFLFRMLRRLGILIENSHDVFLTRQADRSAQSLACFFVVVLHVSVHVLRPRISLRRATCRQDPSFLVSIVPFRIGTSARVPVEDERVAHAVAVAGAAV